MGSGIYFPLFSLVYSLLLIFYCYKRTNNRILKLLIVTNFIGLIIEILCTYAAFNFKNFPVLSDFILKFYLVYINTWIILFTINISQISKKSIKYEKIEKRVFIIAFILLNFLSLILPINLYISKDTLVRYTYGVGVNLVYLASIIFLIYDLFLMFFCIKKYGKKYISKYSSLFILISLGAFAMIIQSTYPGLLLMTSVETFITLLIYFTTDNKHINKKLKEGESHESNIRKHI